MKATRRSNGCWGALVCALLLLLLLGSLLPFFGSGTELVRLRNALLIDELPAQGGWTPEQPPPDFLWEQLQAPEFFRRQVKSLQLERLPSDWDRAMAIATHLLTGQPTLLGGPTKADLRSTYEAIIGEGKGYCADFTRSYTALALAAGMPVRSWAFSFDGYGGHGHVWVEVWLRDRQRWQLLDVYNNYYFTAGGEPLAAMELRQALLKNDPALRLHLIAPQARPGYADERKAWDYFRRGLPEWYLWWGNNAFDYDQSKAVRWSSRLGRGLEQLAAIAAGVHPHIRVLPEADETRALENMERLKLWLLAVLVGSPLLAGLTVYAGLRCRRDRRRALAGQAEAAR